MLARLLPIAALLGMPMAFAVDPASIAERLHEASVQRGERLVSKQCAAACHTYQEGAPGRVGPNLWDVVGKPVAAKEGYRYSRAMRERGREGAAWTYEALDTYLAAPRNFVPGTSMTFVGLKKPEERADVILYLRSLSDEPQPLPETP